MAESMAARPTGLTIGGVAASSFALGQIALALTAMVTPALQTQPVLLFIAVCTVVSSVLMVHAGLPVEAKAVLVAANCAALLGTALVADVFGLRATGGRIATMAAPDPTGTPSPPPAPHRTGAVPGLTIDAVGDARAARLGSDMAIRVAATAGTTAGAPEVATMIAVEDGADGPRYRMTWSLRRGQERLWCGQALVERASAAEAARIFAAMIGQARSVPASEALRCE